MSLYRKRLQHNIWKRMKMNNFCVFILTHGRPHKQITYKSLRKQGYTGKVYFVIDDEDDTADQYYSLYGDKVIMFNKSEIAETFDEADNFNDKRSIVYARNACFQIAKDLGIEYFTQLDDDYNSFFFKFDNNYNYTDKYIIDLDKTYSIFLKYFKSIPAISIAFAQGGDFIGGRYSEKYAYQIVPTRKCMNTFICSTKRAFKFIGRINEDVNVYTYFGSKGFLMLTIPNIAIVQTTTQTNKGGMTDIYLNNGTYIKSFYTVMYCPSFVKIALMGTAHKRLHHMVKWKNAVPVILDEKYKKV
jgi:hypothetical protein